MKQTRLFLLVLSVLLIALLAPSFAMAEAVEAQHVATKVQINGALEPVITLYPGSTTWLNGQRILLG